MARYGDTSVRFFDQWKSVYSTLTNTGRMSVPSHVEFLGITGSGKSTLVPTVTGVIPGARTAKEKYTDSVTGRRFSLVLPLILQLPGWVQRNVIRAYTRLRNMPVYAYHDLLTEYPDFTETIELVMEEANVVEKEHLRRMLIRRAVRYGTIMHEHIPIVFDEGFAMGAIALFSRRRESIDDRLIHQYMTAVPWPDVIIQVNADPEECYQRAQARSGGLPSSIQNLPEEARQDRIAEMSHWTKIVGDIAEQRGTAVIEINNTETISDTKRTLEQKVSESYPPLSN